MSGSLEGKLFAELVRLIGADEVDVARQNDTWPAMRAVFDRIFRSRSRTEWSEISGHPDAVPGVSRALGADTRDVLGAVGVDVGALIAADVAVEAG